MYTVVVFFINMSGLVLFEYFLYGSAIPFYLCYVCLLFAICIMYAMIIIPVAFEEFLSDM